MEYMYDFEKDYDPSFSRTPLTTLYTTDHTGMASIHINDGERSSDDHDEGRQDIDLIITSLSIPYQELSQTQPAIGDIYVHSAFGKAPLTVSFTAVLPDGGDYFGKMFLINAYRDRLRLSAVAKLGNIPELRAKGVYVRGPWLQLSIDEASSSEDTVTVSAAIAATEIIFAGDHSTVRMDFRTGVDAEDDNHGIKGDGWVNSAFSYADKVGHAMDSFESSVSWKGALNATGWALSKAGL